MKKANFILFTFILISNAIMSQSSNKSFFLEHNNKQKEIFYFDNCNIVRFYLEFKPSLASDSNLIILGKIREVGLKQIIISPTESKFTVRYNCDSSYVCEFKSSTPSGTFVFDISDIRLIEYQEWPARNWMGVGGTLIALGSITTLIIAPLISIKYGKGEFYKERYFRMSTIGLGFIAVGIPISIFSKKKNFYLKERYNKKETKIWTIRN